MSNQQKPNYAEENNISNIRSQIKSSTALLLAVLCFVLGEWIALIFFILAYENYEQVNNALTINNIQLSQFELAKAQKNMRIGIIVAIACAIIGLIVGTILIICLGHIVSL